VVLLVFSSYDTHWTCTVDDCRAFSWSLKLCGLRTIKLVPLPFTVNPSIFLIFYQYLNSGIKLRIISSNGWIIHSTVYNVAVDKLYIDKCLSSLILMMIWWIVKRWMNEINIEGKLFNSIYIFSTTVVAF